MKNVAVIGGSISSLSLAYFLDKRRGSKDFNIDILEKDAYFTESKIKKFQYGQEIYDSGWLSTIRSQGIAINFMIELGLDRYLIQSSETKKVLYTNDAIKFYPEKMRLGYPIDKRELLTSDLFDFREKLSLLQNMRNSVKDFDVTKLSVQEFFNLSLNSLIYKKISHLLFMTYYKRDISKESFVTFLPDLALATLQNKSIDKVVAEMYRDKFEDGVCSSKEYRLKFTLYSFLDAMESRYTNNVFLEFNRNIEKIEYKNNKYYLTCSGIKYVYDYVIVGTKFDNFLPLFKEDENIKKYFEGVTYHSNILVTLVYNKKDVYISNEIGDLIIEDTKEKNISSLEYVSNKFTEIKMNDIHIIKAYINDQKNVNKLIDLDDEEIKNIIIKEINDIHKEDMTPIRVYVTKVKNNYRNCDIDYNKTIHNFTDYIEENYPNLHFIGNSIRAIDFENTILEAREVAKNLIEKLK